MTNPTHPYWVDLLEGVLPGRVFRNVSLANISRWQIGGRAHAIIKPRSLEDLVRLRRFLHREGLFHVVFGATSNLLFDDEGIDVPCIQIDASFSTMAVEANRISLAAGVWAPELARRAMQAGLGGLAHISGIPGTMGGLICMNGGSQRKGIGETVQQVVSVDQTGIVHSYDRDACGFSYRRSIFQSNNEIVAGITLELTPTTDRRALRREMIEILASRRRKFPRNEPNCGSVFVSDPSAYNEFGPPGALIEGLGFKGRRVGGAMVSPRHANFIVNRGNATATDVLTLIRQISEESERKTGSALVSEVRFVAKNGQVKPASEVLTVSL